MTHIDYRLEMKSIELFRKIFNIVYNELGFSAVNGNGRDC